MYEGIYFTLQINISFACNSIMQQG